MQINAGKKTEKKEYVFGEIKEYDLEKIESEVLQESVYLDVFAGSDVAFKQDIQEINSKDALNRVLNLNAYQYKYNTESFKDLNFPEGNQIGFMAQEVEQVFPELVKQNENGHRFVNYMQMIPIMAETIKELNAKIENLEKELAKKK